MFLNLPDEVILMILEPLSLPDKLILRRVCVRWQDLLQVLLRRQDLLQVVDETLPSSSSLRARSCFAPDSCRRSRDTERLTFHTFRSMLRSNSVSWFTNLVPGLRVLHCPDLRVTSPLLTAYADRLRCLSCHSVLVDARTKSLVFPLLRHLDVRSMDDVDLLSRCPSLEAMQCWGSVTDAGFVDGRTLFPVSRRPAKVTAYTRTLMQAITGSGSAASLQVLRLHQYEEESTPFHLPALKSLTMSSGFRSNSDKSRKVLLTSVSRSQRLQELDLVFTGLLAAEWIKGLTPLSLTLTRVRLKVQEEVVLFLSRECGRLERITILNGKLTDASVTALTRMNFLTHVSLVRPDVFELASRITVPGILSLLRGNSRHRLQHVSIESRSVQPSVELQHELMMLRHQQGFDYCINDGGHKVAYTTQAHSGSQ